MKIRGCRGGELASTLDTLDQALVELEQEAGERDRAGLPSTGTGRRAQREPFRWAAP